MNIEGTIYRGSLTDNLTGFGEIIWPDLTLTEEKLKGLPTERAKLITPAVKLIAVSFKKENSGTWRNAMVRWKIYRGEFTDGIISGKGDFIDANGERFIGEFRDGKPHGSGTLFSPDSSIYMGEMQNGLKQGRGTLALSNGDLYEGSFVKNQMDGFGEHTSSDGETYKGNFKNGQKHGFGFDF